jgi:hypothetical protein
MPGMRYPTLFQLNTRVWLQRLSREAGRQLTLADIDDAILDGFVENGFDWVWPLSVWQTGAAGRAVSCSNPEWRREFETLLPDLTEDDICGSGFAITAYSVSETIGGEAGLASFRERLASRNIRLMLDYVPNHTAPDHPRWPVFPPPRGLNLNRLYNSCTPTARSVQQTLGDAEHRVTGWLLPAL